MKQRNSNSHRLTEANRARTIKRIEEYEGLNDLLKTWDSMPDEMQIRNHDYILELRRRYRNVKNYLAHRADAGAEL